MSSLKIIAEIGGNHLGDYNRALELIRCAIRAGATHVKFQCFEPEQMVGDPDYKITAGPWKGMNLFELYEQIHTPKDWFPEMFKLVRRYGVVPFASVFHQDDVDYLSSLGCDLFKISSFEAVDHELIEYAQEHGDVLVSTGMLDGEEFYDLPLDVIPMKCVSAYPAEPEDANLNTLHTWRRSMIEFGISDHTRGFGVSVAAVALGATWVEKHFNLDGEGPDGDFSMTPRQFEIMAEACKQAHQSLGSVKYRTDSENPSLKLRRSLWWAEDLEPGDIVSRHHIKSARPADGLPCSEMESVVGSMIVEPVFKNTPIKGVGRYYA